MGKSQKEIVIGFLKELMSHLQTVEDAQFETLMSGQAKLEFNIVPISKAAVEPRKNEEIEDFAKNAAEKLHGIGTREQGDQYLESLYRTKEDLLKIAKYLDLPVQKKETIQQIKDKIIESTIGFRVRSAAVQGTSKDNSDLTKA